jgi:hypothetical protein
MCVSLPPGRCGLEMLANVNLGEMVLWGTHSGAPIRKRMTRTSRNDVSLYG